MRRRSHALRRCVALARVVSYNNARRKVKLGFGVAAPFTRDVIKGSTNAVGTGPFLFDSYKKGAELTLVKNDNFWGEPAHLDSASESAVQGALAAALEGRTSIVIAHRLSTVQALDRLVVLVDVEEIRYPGVGKRRRRRRAGARSRPSAGGRIASRPRGRVRHPASGPRPRRGARSCR